MSEFVLALDQGTTSSRAILFDGGGGIRSTAQREFRQIYPQPGWVEHDPSDIWASQLRVAAEALEAAGVTASDLAAVGISNQRETAIVWDRHTLEPIYNAIVWQDRRTAGFIDQLKSEGLADYFQATTGLVLDAYFSASKVAWLLDHVDGARTRAESGELAFGTVDSWLLAQLTGGEVHATDVSNASRTMLFDIHHLRWDDEILARLGIPRRLLPAVAASSHVFGEATVAPLGGATIAAVAGDQQAATFGQACFEAGQAKNTYGTGCFLMLNTGNRTLPSENKLLTTIAWQRHEAITYALEGSIFVAGAVVQWLRDGLGIIDSAAEVEPLALQVPDNGGVYFVPAFTGLGAPHWDQYARGAVLGLTRGTSAAHLARAALEGIAFQVYEVLEAMTADGGVSLTELRVDGGASNNDLLMQFQADLLNVPVVRPTITETTALGAAYLAGLAVGFWPDEASLARQWAVDRSFEPQMDSATREQLLSGWRRALGRAKAWEPT